MRNWGKEIKDVGILVIIVSIVVLFLAIYTLFSGNEIASAMFGDSFLGMIILGLIGIVTGIILRSVGRSKMAKNETGGAEITPKSFLFNKYIQQSPRWIPSGAIFLRFFWLLVDMPRKIWYNNRVTK